MSAVVLDRDGSVATITLNRPEAMNAINMAVREMLPAALAEADADDAVRVIVLRGAGGRAFCAGADIKEFAPAEDLVAKRQSRVHSPWFGALERVRKPLVAAVDGVCFGGGLEIALACDLRIASRSARFALSETGLGLIPGAGGTQRLPRLVGLGVALDMMLTGQPIDADRAFAIGLVSRLFDDAAFADATRHVAETIAAKAPLASVFAKEAARKGFDLDLGAGLRLEGDLSTLLVNTEDRQEGASAFREKRAPRYRGR